MEHHKQRVWKGALARIPVDLADFWQGAGPPGGAVRQLTSVDVDAALRREREYVSSPRPPGAPVTLLRTQLSVERWGRGSPSLGWDAYLRDDWEIREVPGSHESMIGEPHVHVLATAVGECLRRAQEHRPEST